MLQSGSDQFTVALNVMAKLAAGAKLAAVPATVVPAIDMPIVSLSSAPDALSSSGVVAVPQLEPDAMEPAT